MTDEGQPGTSGTTGRQPGNIGPPILQPHGDIDEETGTTVTGTLPLRLPPFWPKNPQVWFTQVEAHFHLRKITTQIARFYHVVASLPPQVARAPTLSALAPVRRLSGTQCFHSARPISSPTYTGFFC